MGGTYYLEQAGLSTSMSFTFGVIGNVIALLGVVLSWIIAKRAGRFQMYITGLSTQCVILFIIGILGCIETNGSAWAIGGLLMFFGVVYNSGIGPICYCLVAEIPSVKLRTKTIIIARNSYNVALIIVQVINPYIVIPAAWNWKGKAGFLWGGIALAAAIWCYFELPETKGRTCAELDSLFAKKVSARNFKSTEVDVFDAGELMEKIGEEGVKNFVKKDEERKYYDEKT